MDYLLDIANLLFCSSVQAAVGVFAWWCYQRLSRERHSATDASAPATSAAAAQGADCQPAVTPDASVPAISAAAQGADCQSAVTPATSTPARESQAPLRPRKFREPPVFNGDAAEFRQWVFSLEIAMDSLRLDDPEERVLYASSHLSGNAQLWLMSARDGGRVFADWGALKEALGDAYGPIYEQEQARLTLLGLCQTGGLDGYISEFSRHSLLVPDLDEHTKAMLFVKGLADRYRLGALREHPTTMTEAIRAARLSTFSRGGFTEHAWQPSGRSRGRRPAQRLEERRRDVRPQAQHNEFTCFRCHGPGHIARNCPEQAQPNQRPNASSQ